MTSSAPAVTGEKPGTRHAKHPEVFQRTFGEMWICESVPQTRAVARTRDGRVWPPVLGGRAELTSPAQGVTSEKFLTRHVDYPKQLLIPFHPSEHIVNPEKFQRAFLDEMCSLATEVRAVAKSREGKLGLKALLCDRRAMLYFTQPSTRTFLSFDNACHILGIRTSEIRDPSTSSEVKGESLEDSIRTFSSYVDIIIMRSHEPGLAALAANIMDSIERPVPIVNAGSGPDQHPTQALLDIYTLERSFLKRGGIEGKTIGMMGDLARGRTVRSLCHLLCRYPGVRIKFISPKKFGMKSDIKQILERYKIEFEETTTVGKVLRELDALYLTRLQLEYDQDGSAAPYNYSHFRIGPAEMKKMKPDAIVMHPLPRGPELDPAVDNDRRARYWSQERNGMWVRAALLIQLLKARVEFDKLRQELCP